MRESFLDIPKVGQIYKIVNPIFEDDQKKQWVKLARDLSKQWHTQANFQAESNQLIEDLETGIKYGDDLIEEITRRRLLTEEFIKHGSLNKGRLVALREQRGLKPGEEHSWLAPFTKNRQEVEEYLQQTNEQLESARAGINLGYRSVEEATDRAGKKLLEFSEINVVKNEDRSIEYARIIPFRAQELSEVFGKMYGLNPDKVPNLAGFLQIMRGYFNQRATRDRGVFQSLKNGDRPFYEIPVDKLPDVIKRRLEVWTGYCFALKLYQEGIIPEPELPEVLRV